MSRRGRREGGEGMGLLLALGLLGALLLGRLLFDLWWALLAAVVVWLSVRQYRRSRRALPRADRRLGRVTAERDQLEAERDQLAAQLAEARDVAHAAWDAAASRAPVVDVDQAPSCGGSCPLPYYPGGPVPCKAAGKCMRPDQMRSGLLADPRSGARRLGEPRPGGR